MLPSINLNINNSMSVEMLFSMNAEVKFGDSSKCSIQASLNGFSELKCVGTQLY